MQTKTQKITLGTKEWADSNVNCYYGCSNNCKYCYAKKMAIRFNKKTEESWKNMVPNLTNIYKNYGKRKGRVMFPTSHDITPEALLNCIEVLKKLINTNNQVLITTKPRLSCVKNICEEFSDRKTLIQFRLTITSYDNDLLSFWEPQAPSFEERLKALIFAFENNYRTSVSIEPFLDENPFTLVQMVKPYVTESIWIGKMNYVNMSNVSPNELSYYKKIKYINSKPNLVKILNFAKNYDKSFLRIKDSIYNFLRNH